MPASRVHLISAALAVVGGIAALTSTILRNEQILREQKLSRTFVIDPGHGGPDLGAVSELIREKHVALVAAMQTGWEATKSGDLAVLTRQEDRALSIDDRIRLADQVDLALFVSLHADRSESSGVSGIRIYYPDCTSENASDQTLDDQFEALLAWRRCQSSRISAGKVAEKLAKASSKQITLHEASYRVLLETKHPSILIELGFLSSSEDEARLRDPKWMARFSQSLLAGLVAARDLLTAY